MADQYREETDSLDKIPETFQQAKDNLQLHQFYGDKDEHVFTQYKQKQKIKPSIFKFQTRAAK